MAVRHLLTAAALSLTLCVVPSVAFAEVPNGPPQQPNLENITDTNEANRLVDQYNNEVDSHNQQLENEYNKQVEEIDQYNKEVDNYNTQVDLNYEQAVQETEKKNEEVEAHNAAEQQRVIDESAVNEKAQADADARNAEIDKENTAEQERINKINEERQQQYGKDKAQYNTDLVQYEKDLVMEKRIKDAGYESVEQYNEMINTRYNNPAKESVEKNASAKEISIDDTYIVTDSTEKSGRLIPVHIEHNFSEVGLSYVKDFYIDAKDSILLLSIGALVETTQPDYACFYYKTDDAHSMGYWISAGSTLYFYPSAYVEDGWDCGDSHFLTYKDSINDYVWSNEDIHIIYDYIWQPLKIYKTYNIPNEPVEPTLELETYIPIRHVEPELIDVISADIWEAIPDPIKDEYLTYKDYPKYPELLGYMDYINIIENQIEQDQNQEFINQQINSTPERSFIRLATNKNTISIASNETAIENEMIPLIKGIGISPEYAYADTIEDEKTPMTAGEVEKNWALVNLILMIISILVLIKLPRKNDEEKDYEYKHHNNIISVILAIAAVIMFILTENIWLPMTLVDSWTIWMAIICGGAIIARFFSHTTKEEVKEEE